MSRKDREALSKEMPGKSSETDLTHIVCTHHTTFDFRIVPLTFSKDNALLQQIEICKQDGPSKHNLGFLRSWLDSVKGNDCSLRGPGSNVWDVGEAPLRDTENDFLVLSLKHSNRDRFERWMGETLLQFYHRFIGRRRRVSHMFHTVDDVLTS